MSARPRPVLLLSCALALACQGSTSHPEIPPAVSRVSLSVASPPQGERRGPVLLRFTVKDPASEITALHLKQGDGSAATAKLLSASATDVLMDWESFSDVSANAEATLHLVAETAAGEAQVPVTVTLRNDPETDRLVLVGQNLVDLPGGGATANGTSVSAFGWSGVTHQLAGDPVRLTVGTGPSAFRAAPHGRATAVVESTGGTVSLVATPLEAATSGVHVLASLTFGHGSAGDARWSPDGRYLYVAVLSDGTQPSAMWRVEPSEDLSSVPAAQPLFNLPGPPSRFDVDRVSGNLLVACGSGGAGLSKLVLYDPAGRELARLEEYLDSANALAIHPLGGFALWLGDFSGDQVRRFQFDSKSITEVTPFISTVAAPQEVVFHPASTIASGAALVSNSQHDTVTPLTLAESSVTPGTPVGKVPLASELDLIERGSQTGTVFSVAVSAVYRLTLSVDGHVQNQGVIHDFGINTTDILQGIAIQR